MKHFSIARLYIYPVKGLKGIAVTSADAMSTGFSGDRQWMIVNQRGQFLTQREIPAMAGIHTSLNDKTLTLRRNSLSYQVDNMDKAGREMVVTVWEHKVIAVEPDPGASQWLSDMLGTHCHLISRFHKTKRIKTFGIPPGQTVLSFADGYPYSIMGTASLEKLNEHLDTPVSEDRFRANIIVNTTEPHCEDSWDQFTAGSALLKNIKACARCQVIAVDQQTGKKIKEPLDTLRQYRQRGHKVYFGTNAILSRTGTIKTGDPVELK